MKLLENIKGNVYVEVEGFFVERFINLCNINNLKINNVQNITAGIIRFYINPSDFKKLKDISKKTKCKVKIIHKKGIYFNLFKYRKRKFLVILIVLIIVIFIFTGNFIWNIEVNGNTVTTKEDIIEAGKNAGIYVGSYKSHLNKNEAIRKIRSQLNVAWVGVEIDGTKAIINIVEKTELKNINDDLNTTLIR